MSSGGLKMVFGRFENGLEMLFGWFENGLDMASGMVLLCMCMYVYEWTDHQNGLNYRPISWSRVKVHADVYK